MYSVLLLLLLVVVVGANNIEHTTNSVDIQVCVDDAVLSSERDALQAAVLTALSTALATDNAVYPLRRYTMSGVCFIFVYQAQSPYAARDCLVPLDSVKTILFNGDNLQARITAVPWRGEELPLGAPSIDALMIWGIASIALLFSCILGMCCYVALRRPAPLSSAKGV